MRKFISILLPFVVLASDAPVEIHPENYKVVCYYPNWSGDVTTPWNYRPSLIDTTLCTHIFYAFAILNPTSLEMGPSDPEDETSGYKNIVDLKNKNPDLKVLLSLGGGTDSNDNSSKYADLVKSSGSRKNFISTAIAYLEKYKFDGLDIDWEYPTDKANYINFLQELNKAFKPKGFLLSAAVSADNETVTSAYDVPEMNKYLDMINVMAYDYSQYSNETKFTGENAPIDQAEKAIELWSSKGAASAKLLIGIPFYGVSFTLQNTNETDIGAPASGPGDAGQFTMENGSLAYFEICTGKNWTKERDPDEGVFAYKGNQWVGYDDPQTVEIKSNYAKDKKLGGVMLWNLSQDDFRGECCEDKNREPVKYPLLNVINNVLRGIGKSAGSMNCH